MKKNITIILTTILLVAACSDPSGGSGPVDNTGGTGGTTEIDAGGNDSGGTGGTVAYSTSSSSSSMSGPDAGSCLRVNADELCSDDCPCADGMTCQSCVNTEQRSCSDLCASGQCSGSVTCPIGVGLVCDNLKVCTLN